MEHLFCMISELLSYLILDLLSFLSDSSQVSEYIYSVMSPGLVFKMFSYIETVNQMFIIFNEPIIQLNLIDIEIFLYTFPVSAIYIKIKIQKNKNILNFFVLYLLIFIFYQTKENIFFPNFWLLLLIPFQHSSIQKRQTLIKYE